MCFLNLTEKGYLYWFYTPKLDDNAFRRAKQKMYLTTLITAIKEKVYRLKSCHSVDVPNKIPDRAFNLFSDRL